MKIERECKDIKMKQIKQTESKISLLFTMISQTPRKSVSSALNTPRECKKHF